MIRKTKTWPWQCRVSPTLGALEGTHSEAWGTREYANDTDPTVFMGLYGLPDFYALWRHGGEKHILWCGTDIIHFVNGYWLEDQGNIRLSPRPLIAWLNKNCQSWAENEVEAKALNMAGGKTKKISPSFFGDKE